MKKSIITLTLILSACFCYAQKDTTIKITGDTLKITDASKINFILIGGILYEVKKSISIQKVESGIKTMIIDIPSSYRKPVNIGSLKLETIDYRTELL
jgi:hypothetical protein